MVSQASRVGIRECEFVDNFEIFVKRYSLTYPPLLKIFKVQGLDLGFLKLWTFDDYEFHLRCKKRVNIEIMYIYLLQMWQQPEAG
jgi:hypothetical protein